MRQKGLCTVGASPDRGQGREVVLCLWRSRCLAGRTHSGERSERKAMKALRQWDQTCLWYPADWDQRESGPTESGTGRRRVLPGASGAARSGS